MRIVVEESSPVKNGAELDRAGLSCAECTVDLGLRQIFALFQMEFDFLGVKSERLSMHFQSPPVFYCVLLHYTETFKGSYFWYTCIQVH
jgi:hypothetical protein